MAKDKAEKKIVTSMKDRDKCHRGGGDSKMEAAKDRLPHHVTTGKVSWSRTAAADKRRKRSKWRKTKLNDLIKKYDLPVVIALPSSRGGDLFSSTLSDSRNSWTRTKVDEPILKHDQPVSKRLPSARGGELFSSTLDRLNSVNSSSLESPYCRKKLHPERSRRGIQALDPPPATWNRGRRRDASVKYHLRSGADCADSSTTKKDDETVPRCSNGNVSDAKAAYGNGKSTEFTVNAELTQEASGCKNACCSTGDKKSEKEKMKRKDTKMYERDCEKMKRKDTKMYERDCDHSTKIVPEDTSHKSLSSHQASDSQASSCHKSKKSAVHGPKSKLQLPPQPPKVSNTTPVDKVAYQSSGLNTRSPSERGRRLADSDLNKPPTLPDKVARQSSGLNTGSTSEHGRRLADFDLNKPPTLPDKVAHQSSGHNAGSISRRGCRLADFDLNKPPT